MSERFSPKVKSTPKQKEPPHKKRQLSTSTQSDESMVSMTFTKEEIESMIKNAIASAITSFKSEIEKLFIDKLNQYESEHFILEKQVDDLEKKLKETEECVQNLNGKNVILEKELNENKTNINDLEQYGRRWNLRIFGIEEKGKDENCKQHIIDLCKNKLNIDITDNDIDAAHRVGASHNNRPRGIIVRFYRRTIRNDIIRARRALKGSAVSIREDLTRLNQALLNRAMNHPRVDRAWTWNGKINVVGHNGNRVTLTPFCDIDSVLDIANLGH